MMLARVFANGLGHRVLRESTRTVGFGVTGRQDRQASSEVTTRNRDQTSLTVKTHWNHHTPFIKCVFYKVLIIGMVSLDSLRLWGMWSLSISVWDFCSRISTVLWDCVHARGTLHPLARAHPHEDILTARDRPSVKSLSLSHSKTFFLEYSWTVTLKTSSQCSFVVDQMVLGWLWTGFVNCK